MATEIINNKKFGTAPVFFTAISTILGAILFLRFGYAVGTLGFWGVMLIILLGHSLTVPTALAISELATNKRVEGGGEYFIISRSFGLNIGATIGIALFLSQAISVAFYVIAFTETFEFVFNAYSNTFGGRVLPRQVMSVPIMVLMSIIILKKGASGGTKTLYLIVAILGISLLMFFMGKTDFGGIQGGKIPIGDLRNMDQFFIVFGICFPAFTGMTAGVGLSGDLKNPSKSIPLGTTLATFIGMIIYILVTYKLAVTVSPEEMLAEGNQLIMKNIALGGAIIIPFGLAASTLSSALGSVMVAPRTLQALALDKSFPSQKMNNWLASSRKSDDEPVNASIVTIIIALTFILMGSVDAVAKIISIFFLVSYGSLCLISFLNHFGSSPSYRPSFKSRWFISLLGFLLAVWVMFKIDTKFAVVAVIMMVGLYLFVNIFHKDRLGLESLFANALFQINRNIQVYLQRSGSKVKQKEWRPSAICISKDSFIRSKAFQLLNWISYKYGFGTYLHRIDGYYSKATHQQATEELAKLIDLYDTTQNHLFVDTIISPSYTSAIVQAIQVPGISGMENNMVVFEYDKENPKDLPEIIENIGLIKAGAFDICLLASSSKEMIFKNGIHIWIDFPETENASLLILLSFIISGHPDWKKAPIKVFEMCYKDQYEKTRETLSDLVQTGRLPITENNIEIVVVNSNENFKNIINDKSGKAALTMIGFSAEALKRNSDILSGYDQIGSILFVNSHTQKEIS
jgi:amino acid transporter